MLLDGNSIHVRQLDEIAKRHGVPDELAMRLFQRWTEALRRVLGVPGRTGFAVCVMLHRLSAHQRLRHLNDLRTADWTSFERMLRTGHAPR